ncbi:MAG: hypothetical protein ACFBSE_25085 [Prochloraceae cyanobacterium]
MFNRLPDLLGRIFFISHFFPALIFLIGICLPNYLVNFLDLSNIEIIKKAKLLEIISSLTILSIILGIFFLVLNRSLINLIQGEGECNIFKLLLWGLEIERKRFKKLEKNIADIDKKYLSYSNNNKDVPDDIKNRYRELIEKKVTDFPDAERWLMPTEFGNALKSFQTYSRVMYGADAIPIWTRLLVIIPENYSKLIDEEKAFVDFWVNTWIVSIILTFVYFIEFLYVDRLIFSCLLLFSLVLICYAYEQAIKSVKVWGNFIKAGFDLFLDELKDRLKIGQDDNNNNSDRDLWENFSKAVLYREYDSLQNLKPRLVCKNICIILEQKDIDIVCNYSSNLVRYVELQPEKIQFMVTKLPESLDNISILVFDIFSLDSRNISLIENIDFDGDIIVFSSQDMFAKLPLSLSNKVTEILVKPIDWKSLKDKRYFA